MQQADIVSEILQHIKTIDYTRSATDTKVSLFETTIRYLGGMLSGYDLLKGPFCSLAHNQTALVDNLLHQSTTLANALKFAFDSPSGIPRNNLNLTNHNNTDKTNGLATIGSLVLEWTRLSDLTGDPQYTNLTQKAESYLINATPAYNVPFPGLPGSNFDVNTGKLLDATGGWVGGDDSYYEYLIKS